MRKKRAKLPPVHPGQVLTTILEDAGISANALALALCVPPKRLTEILNERRSISAEVGIPLTQPTPTCCAACSEDLERPIKVS